MRPTPDAGILPWPKRIPRPWVIASASGLVIGTLLIRLEQLTHLDSSFSEYPPRAAVYDSPGTSSPDPLANLALPVSAPGQDGGPATTDTIIPASSLESNP
jgi:hypothetical protein